MPPKMKMMFIGLSWIFCLLPVDWSFPHSTTTAPWPDGARYKAQGSCMFNLTAGITAWTLNITFNKNIEALTIWRGDTLSNNSMWFCFKNKYPTNPPEQDDVQFEVLFQGVDYPLGECYVNVNSNTQCLSSDPTTFPPETTTLPTTLPSTTSTTTTSTSTTTTRPTTTSTTLPTTTTSTTLHTTTSTTLPATTASTTLPTTTSTTLPITSTTLPTTSTTLPTTSTLPTTTTTSNTLTTTSTIPPTTTTSTLPTTSSSPTSTMAPSITIPKSTINTEGSPTTTLVEPRPTAHTPSPICSCRCQNLHNSNNDTIMTDARFEQMIERLLVSKQSLSSTRRKLSSASDDRVTSRSIGILGISFLVFVALLMVVSDLLSFIQHSSTSGVDRYYRSNDYYR